MYVYFGNLVVFRREHFKLWSSTGKSHRVGNKFNWVKQSVEEIKWKETKDGYSVSLHEIITLLEKIYSYHSLFEYRKNQFKIIPVMKAFVYSYIEAILSCHHQCFHTMDTENKRRQKHYLQVYIWNVIM